MRVKGVTQLFFQFYQSITRSKNEIRSNIIPHMTGFDSDKLFLLNTKACYALVAKLSALRGEEWIRA
jgi:hypothetical protein